MYNCKQDSLLKEGMIKGDENMAKLTKQMYYKANGERKINCYKVAISKEIVKQANIQDNDEIKVYADKNKIIIEKI